MTHAGLFISFEGGEGAGKSTQVGLLVRRLQTAGRDVCLVHEPGGTALGEYLRTWLKATDRPLTAEAELLLFAAARAELVRRVVLPALEAGAVVVADRFADSTTAYQGHGRRLPMRQVMSANRLAIAGCWPDLTVLLDADPAIGLARSQARDAASDTGQDSRRFESAELAFHRRVRRGFLRIAEREPKRWLALDAAAPTEQTAAAVWRRVAALLSAHP
jgi:dTMP kinase